jgi:hypothetical protein
VGLDPIADQMLVNLVDYTASAEHETQPLINSPIVWGDYPTERGVLTGPQQGLVYNCRWVQPPGAPNAQPMPDNTGAWNTHPGNPFVPHGVRPFGPYSWSTGASPREAKDPTGSGFFHCRIPSGKRWVVSQVENTDKAPQAITVSVNNQAAPPQSIAPGQTVDVRTPIPNVASDIQVNYSGKKQLVILQTAFE